MTQHYWLFKSEPNTFSIDDLARSPNQTAPWDGVRNYQARNTLRDNIQIGDEVFFYHSSCAVPAIVGIMEVVKAGYPEKTPPWFCVDVKLKEKLTKPIPLALIKQNPQLADLILVRKGNRLSIMPITAKQWHLLLKETV